MRKRIQEIDVLKGMAIIAVIILHAIPQDTLLALGSPFTFEQAVPVFMVLMGFNSTMSFERKGMPKLNQLYSRKFLTPKLKRVLIPFLIVFVIEEYLLTSYYGFSLGSFLFNLLSGGESFGGYFIPVSLQAMLILPLLYRFLKKTNGWGGIVLVFALSYAADYFGIYLGEEFYRLFIGRYLFAIALGVYLFFNKKKLTWKRVAPFAILSVVYVFLVDYAGVSTLVETYWGSQHTLSYFWTLLIVVAGLKAGKATKGKQFLGGIGKASYHIFLVQHLYFYMEKIYYPVDGDVTNTVLALVFSLVIGSLYYQIDKKLVRTRSLLVPRF